MTNLQAAFLWYESLGKVSSFTTLLRACNTSASAHWHCTKSCLHGTIATAINCSQLMGSMGFSVIVAVAPCEHLH